MVYIGKVQKSGQRSKEKVVHLAPGLVSLTKTKSKVIVTRESTNGKAASPADRRDTSAQAHPVSSSSILNTTCVQRRHRVFCRAPVHRRSIFGTFRFSIGGIDNLF